MPLAPVDRIETPRLALVPLAEAHLADLMAVNGDDAVTDFLPYASWQSPADATAWFARMDALVAGGTARQLVLVDKTDGRAIGTLLLFKHDEPSRRIEIGYALGARHQGRGLMAEALVAACAHAFGALAIRRIEAEVNPANRPSCALLERTGFVREGTLRQRWTAKGRTYDTHIYGLLAEDWHPERGGTAT